MIKRLIALISLLLAATSCCKDNLSSQEESPMRLQKGESITRTKENALNIALKAQEEFFGTSTRSQTESTTIKSDQILVKTRPSTRAVGSLDTLYYIVNFTDDSGFAIVAANKNEEPLIAITEKGSFSGDHTGVYGFDLYMEETENRLAESAATTPQQGPDEMVTIICDTVSVIREEMPEMIDIKWHQGEPFNWFCPEIAGVRSPAGCPAIAVAQAMAYYQYPSELTLTYPGHSVNKISLSWQEMTKHWSPDLFCEYCTLNAHLVREVGYVIGTRYSYNGSGIDYPETLKANIVSLGYTCDTYERFETNAIVKSLKDKHPVIITGIETDDTGIVVGHIWNVFGYKRFYQHIKYYINSGGKRPIQTDGGYSITEKNYLYLNYGHADDKNGYYLSFHQQTDSGIKVVDGGTSVKTYVSVFDGKYNDDVRMLTNFKPIEQ